VTEPAPELSGLLGAAGLDDVLADVVRLVAPLKVVPGWGTVELARTAGTIPAIEPTTADQLLGAFAAIVRLDAQRQVVLLEPSTEGPLAAALARHGEGWVAAYLRGVGSGADERLRAAGYSLSALGRGPFGPERRVLVGRSDGPFVVLVSEP
jgi:hypothetical protein